MTVRSVTPDRRDLDELAEVWELLSVGPDCEEPSRS